MKLLILISLLFVATSFMSINVAFGQSGCLIPFNSTVYTEQDNQGLVNAVLAIVFGGNPVYKAMPNEPSLSACTANSQKKWVSGSQNCTVCPYGYSFNLGVITGCQTQTYQGKVATYTMVQCNLDNYSWALVTATGIFGLLIIRKRNKS